MIRSSMLESVRTTKGESMTNRAGSGWLYVPDLEAEYDLPASTVYGLRYTGNFPAAYKIAGKLRWRREDVDAWIEDQREPDRVSA